MLYKSVKVISDQFEHLYICFLFGEIAKTGVAEGGVPYSLFHFVTQNVNIFVKTKNDPNANGGSAHLGIIPTLSRSFLSAFLKCVWVPGRPSSRMSQLTRSLSRRRLKYHRPSSFPGFSKMSKVAHHLFCCLI